MKSAYKCNGKLFATLKGAMQYANKLGDEQNIIAGIEKVRPDEMIHTIQTANGRAKVYHVYGTNNSYQVDLFLKGKRTPYAGKTFSGMHDAIAYVQTLKGGAAK